MYPPYGGCMCMQYGPVRLLAMWQARAMPIVSKWVLRGHKVDFDRLTKTSLLVIQVEKGRPDCFSEEVRLAGHSHHLKGCKWREQPVQEV